MKYNSNIVYTYKGESIRRSIIRLTCTETLPIQSSKSILEIYIIRIAPICMIYCLHNLTKLSEMRRNYFKTSQMDPHGFNALIISLCEMFEKLKIINNLLI